MRSLQRVLVGWIVSSAATTSLAEGCQRIHREAGEVCDIFIQDYCEEGIKRLSQIAFWSVKWLKQLNPPAIIWYFTVSPFSISSLFSPPCFSRTANPAASSSDSLSATLWIKTTGATDGRKSFNARFVFCFFIPSVNRALKKLTALRGCCVNALLTR